LFCTKKIVLSQGLIDAKRSMGRRVLILGILLVLIVKVILPLGLFKVSGGIEIE